MSPSPRNSDLSDCRDDLIEKHQLFKKEVIEVKVFMYGRSQENRVAVKAEVHPCGLAVHEAVQPESPKIVLYTVTAVCRGLKLPSCYRRRHQARELVLRLVNETTIDWHNPPTKAGDKQVKKAQRIIAAHAKKCGGYYYDIDTRTREGRIVATTGLPPAETETETEEDDE